MGDTSNRLKTVLLLTGLTVLFVLAGRLLGGTGGMIVAFGLALMMNSGAYWFSDKLALAMSGAKSVSLDEAPHLHQTMERIALQAGMPKPRVYVIENSTPNAFATGRNPAHAAIAVTRGLQEVLDRDELAAVLAHELAHIRNRDTLIGALVATMAGAIIMIAGLGQRAFISGGLGRGEDDDADAGAMAGIIFGILMVFFAPLAATLIQLGITRAREFGADAMGASIMGDPLPLARALEKLEQANQNEPMRVNPATAHQFTVQPFVGGGLMALFSMHPPVASRAERLRKLALRPTFHQRRWK